MTDQTPIQKSFVTPDDSASIVCPQCNGAKLIAVRQFRHHLHMLRVKCKCGHAFKVQLEFRSQFRKTTQLPATYNLTAPAGSGGVAKVINLSLNGACIELRGFQDLKIGQKGILVFSLDNRNKTLLKKAIHIRAVNGNRIGCEFVEDQAFEKELGFYLRT
jgi:hypothetical protein